MQSSTTLPCLNCTLGCGLNNDLSFIWNSSAEPAKDDRAFTELVRTLVDTLSELVKTQQITTPTDLGMALGALFDLCVSLEYARLITDTDWVYCPATQQHAQPMLFYSYVKACPRCAASGKVEPAVSHKPGSDTIGRIAAKVLGALLVALCKQTGNDWQVRQTTRRVFDIDMLLFTTETLVLCEVKASPLVAFPLAITLKRELRHHGQESEQQPIVKHRKTDVPLEKVENVSLYVPHIGQLYDLGSPDSPDYPICQFINLYAHDAKRVLEIIRAWQQLYKGYERKWNKVEDNCLRWLTFGCGGQVDDSKNSPGIDRTDDIKKGIYQMLKLGHYFSSKCKKNAIRVALLANVHAVRHHNDYLSGLEDVIWTHENLLFETEDPRWRKVRVDDLLRLYDAVIAFTRPHFRDSQLEEGFGLDRMLARLAT